MEDSSKPAVEYQSRHEPAWIQRSQILNHGLGAQAPESLYLWQEHSEQARPNLTNPTTAINTLRSAATAVGWAALSSDSVGNSKILLFLFFFVLSLQIPGTRGNPSLTHRFWKKQKKRLLTVGDLQQGFGDDAASDVQGLAAVVAHVWALSVGDGEVPGLRHRQSAEGLRRLWGEEQVLSGDQNKKKFQNQQMNTWLHCWLWFKDRVCWETWGHFCLLFTWLPSRCQNMAGWGFPVASHWKVTVLPTPTTWFLGLTTKAGGTGGQPRGRVSQPNRLKNNSERIYYLSCNNIYRYMWSVFFLVFFKR